MQEEVWQGLGQIQGHCQVQVDPVRILTGTCKVLQGRYGVQPSQSASGTAVCVYICESWTCLDTYMAVAGHICSHSMRVQHQLFLASMRHPGSIAPQQLLMAVLALLLNSSTLQARGPAEAARVKALHAGGAGDNSRTVI